MNIYFKLRQQGKTDPVIIMQVFDSRFKGRKFMYSTGHAIKRSNWKGKSKPERGWPKETVELLPIIDHLTKLRSAVEEWGNGKLSSRTLNREDLKRHLDNQKKDDRREREVLEQAQKDNDFFETWKIIIDTTKHPKTGKPIKEGTTTQKFQTRNLVTDYSIDRKFTPTLLNIDLNFYHSFDQYMRDKGLDTNTRGKHFKELKAFLREASERDYDVNGSFQKKSFRVLKEEVDDTYLTMPEIKKIREAELSPRLSVLRDILVTNCFTGLRYSDWKQVGDFHLVQEGGKDMLKIKQKKTEAYVHIPLHPAVREFLEKYKNEPPRIISGQKFNEAIKEICKKALKDKDEKPIVITLNGKPVEKWTACSSHTIRRSFATNAYLSKSMDVHLIMAITGHKTEKAFLIYLKLDNMDKAKLAAEAKFFNDAEWNTLKVA